MRARYARLRMLVAPNWRVNPTAASARIEAVTSPKPTEGMKMEAVTARACCGDVVPALASPRGRDLVRRVGHDRRVAVRLDDLELPRRVAVLVEGDRAGGAGI